MTHTGERMELTSNDSVERDADAGAVRHERNFCDGPLAAVGPIVRSATPITVQAREHLTKLGFE